MKYLRAESNSVCDSVNPLHLDSSESDIQYINAAVFEVHALSVLVDISW